MIDEKLMVWGTHENPNSKFYALGHPSASRFYFTSENYDHLKLIQLITMASRTAILIPISDVPGYEVGLIDNSVCTNWGINSPMGSNPFNGLAAEYKVRSTFDSLKETKIIIDHQEQEFIKNIYLLSYLLTHTNGFIERNIATHVDHRHNNALIDFFKITMPQDTGIIDLVKFDKSLLVSLETDIRNCKPFIIKMLSDINWSLDHTIVIATIQDALKSLPYYSSSTQQRFANFIKSTL
jgi:hypothetical protein